MTEKPSDERKVRRLRARRVMEMLAVTCVVVAASPAVEQLTTRGWQSFISRPPGVGATLSEDRVGPQVAAARPGTAFTPEPDSADNPGASTLVPQPAAPAQPQVAVVIRPLAKVTLAKPVQQPRLFSRTNSCSGYRTYHR